MKVALMGRSLRPPLTGIGRYTINLARELADRPELDLTVFVTRETDDLSSVLKGRVSRAPLPTPHELMRGLWEQTLVAADVRRARPDVYHSPNYAIPLTLPCPSVLTVHDLAYLDPRFHNRRLRIYLRLFTDFSIRKAARVIAVSEFTRSQIVARYPDAEKKTSVVYSGLDPSFENKPSATAVGSYLDEIGLRRPYILFVGSIEPRKNLVRLIKAFEAVVARTGVPHALIICGPWGWRYDASREAIEASPIADRIRVLGYQPAEKLPLIYAGASVFAYPSLQEGFGFPPLEAMAMGAPVLTSNNSALPEVVGDAAVTVDPTDTGSLADGLESLLTDAHLRESLVEKGYERAGRFTWARTAGSTLAVYAEAIRTRRDAA